MNPENEAHKNGDYLWTVRGSVTFLGDVTTTDLDGVPVTKYEMYSVDPSSSVPQTSKADLYLDDKNQIRRYEIFQDPDFKGTLKLVSTSTFDKLDEPVVTEPPADAVWYDDEERER